MIGVTATKAHRRTPEPQAERKKKKVLHTVYGHLLLDVKPYNFGIPWGLSSQEMSGFC